MVLLRLACLIPLAGCAIHLCPPEATAGGRHAPSPTDRADPSAGLVELPALAGWRAELALDVGPIGVWCARPFEVFPAYAGPEPCVVAESGRTWAFVAHPREGVVDRRPVERLDGRATHSLAVASGELAGGAAALLALTEPAASSS